MSFRGFWQRAKEAVEPRSKSWTPTPRRNPSTRRSQTPPYRPQMPVSPPRSPQGSKVLDPIFESYVEQAYGAVVGLIGCLYEPLHGGKLLKDPDFAEALKWGNDLYSEAIACHNHPLSTKDITLMLQYTPILIQSLPKYVTKQIASELQLDPLAEQWAINYEKNNPLAEEIYPLGENRTQRDRDGYFIGSGPPGHRIMEGSAAYMGDKSEAMLFQCIVALVIRSLRRWVIEVKRGAGAEVFSIIPSHLDPVVQKWAKLWFRWWMYYGRDQ